MIHELVRALVTATGAECSRFARQSRELECIRRSATCLTRGWITSKKLTVVFPCVSREGIRNIFTSVTAQENQGNRDSFAGIIHACRRGAAARINFGKFTSDCRDLTTKTHATVRWNLFNEFPFMTSYDLSTTTTKIHPAATSNRPLRHDPGGGNT